jgi:DNA-binding transcriptional ArsR family regulator
MDRLREPGRAAARDDDAVWRALANPTRRALLDALRDGPRTTGEIEAALGGGRQVVVQHLAVLRDAGLVLVERQGRRRLNHLNAVPIQRIHERWVSRYTQPWVAALVGLQEVVEGSRDPHEQEESAVG